MDLYEIIAQSASAALKTQKDDGSMPPGWNGPYHQDEMPVRNTAHWLITFIKAYEITKDEEYKEAAKKCAKYLLNDELRPTGATFLHRDIARKDKCNGLIGQAWIIEALISASEKLRINNCSELAKEVFLLHPFVDKCGLWRRVDTNGKIIDFDYAFNHQLWFAACGAMIDDREVKEEILKFMDNLNENTVTTETGLIKHFVISNCCLKTRIYGTIIKIYLKKKGKEHAQTLEEGYQSFNLYAFALLKQRIPQHPFWESNKFISSLNHIKQKSYCDKLKNNRYGFPYNPVGFENAFVIHTFPKIFKENPYPPSFWVSWQMKEHFDFEKGSMIKNTEDPITLSARIYEATRLPNVTFHL